MSHPAKGRRQTMLHIRNFLKFIVSIHVFVVLLALNSKSFAWDETERNDEIAQIIESISKLKAMLEVCDQNEIAETLQSALIIQLNEYILNKELSREDRDEMLAFIQADVDYVFSRLEMSLDAQQCERLRRTAELWISQSEIATHNN